MRSLTWPQVWARRLTAHRLLETARELPPDSVRLLPHYDCYGIGCHPRDRLVPPAWQARALAGGAAGPFPLVLVNGVVAGTWKRRPSGRRVEVTVQPFSTLTRRQSELLEVEAGRLGRILEAEVRLSVSPPP
jgi:Winged helix DNA-binding domain